MVDREAVSVFDLTKRYPGAARKALVDISLSVPVGVTCGVIGPNGAGKSTLLNCLVGLEPASAGTALLGGWSMGTSQAKAGVSFAPDDLPLPTLLTGREYSGFVNALERRDARADAVFVELAEQFGIAHSIDTLMGTYSHGMRRRLQFAVSFGSSAEIIILDEPFSGLDIEGSLLLRAALKAWTQSGRTALVSIHDMLTAERECDFGAVLCDGRLVGSGEIQAIIADSGALDLEGAVLALSGIRDPSEQSRIEFGRILSSIAPREQQQRVAGL